MTTSSRQPPPRGSAPGRGQSQQEIKKPGTLEVVHPEHPPGLRPPYPDARFSRIPILNKIFGVSLDSFSKTLRSYQGLMQADKELKAEFVDHQRVEMELRDLPLILENDHLARVNALNEQRRIAEAADLERQLAIEDLESELEQRKYNKVRLRRMRSELEKEPDGQQ